MLNRGLACLINNAKVKVSRSPELNPYVLRYIFVVDCSSVSHFSTAILPSPSFVIMNEIPTPELPFAISLKSVLQVVQGPLHTLLPP